MFYRDEINHLRTPLVTVIRRVCGKSDAPVKQHFSIERNLREVEEDTDARIVYISPIADFRVDRFPSLHDEFDAMDLNRIRRQIHE